jgi:hypothetical protein
MCIEKIVDLLVQKILQQFMTLIISLAVASTSVIAMYATDRRDRSVPPRDYIKYFLLILACSFLLTIMMGGGSVKVAGGGGITDDSSILESISHGVKMGNPGF